MGKFSPIGHRQLSVDCDQNYYANFEQWFGSKLCPGFEGASDAVLQRRQRTLKRRINPKNRANLIDLPPVPVIYCNFFHRTEIEIIGPRPDRQILGSPLYRLQHDIAWPRKISSNVQPRRLRPDLCRSQTTQLVELMAQYAYSVRHVRY